MFLYVLAHFLWSLYFKDNLLGFPLVSVNVNTDIIFHQLHFAATMLFFKIYIFELRKYKKYKENSSVTLNMNMHKSSQYGCEANALFVLAACLGT